MLFSVFLVILWISKWNLLSAQTGHLFPSWCCFSFSITYISLYFFCIVKHSAHHTLFVTPCSCPAFWFLCVHCSGKLPQLLLNWLLLFLQPLKVPILTVFLLWLSFAVLPVAQHLSVQLSFLTFCELLYDRCCNFSIWTQAPKSSRLEQT